jgi:demethylmenaquinone methyltransferase / 2-methoxy-6-polyprenyl-1,4-benzoquinol methylase
VAFGLRNMTHKDASLGRDVPRAQTHGPLAGAGVFQGGQALEKAYDWYSFKVLPRLGSWVAGDDASYRYLAESIRMHPDQDTLKGLMQQAGFGHVDCHNLTGGVVALHVGIKC